MNKRLLLVTSVLALTSLAGCSEEASAVFGPTVIPEADKSEKLENNPAIYPDELLMNHRVASLLVGEKYELKPMRQFNYEIANVTYTSKNPAIATVDANGEITGVKGGETEIVCADKNNPDFSATVKVIVSPKINQSTATELADEIKAQTKDAEEARNTLIDFELYEKTIYKVSGEGENRVKELQSYDRYDQRMTISVDDAYFRIWETDAEIRTTDGAIDFTNYEWIFYTNAFFDTYIYHQTGDVKNYFPVATQSYMDGNRIDPLNAILDNLFVSGSEILTNTLSQSKVTRITGSLGSGTSGSNRILGSLGDGQVVFQSTDNFEDTADQDDESRYGIPFGTKLTQVQTARYSIKDNRLIASAIHLDESYVIDGQEYLAEYDIDHAYYELDDPKTQIYVPNRKEYTQVDTLFSI